MRYLPQQEHREFPRDFAWGAGTASYQVEGHRRADGAGESTWDVFCQKPGKVWRGHHGEPACDHYNRYADDVRLFAELGLNAYRFSISWPRVLPGGVGAVNERGLDFYDRLVDALLEQGITPWVTLFHWDYPMALYARGGWLNRDSVDWFARYAEIVTRCLSDRVRHFITINEPEVFVGPGHQQGRHAPGDTHALREVLGAGHHVLLAHGTAVQAMRAAARQPLKLGIAPVGEPRVPYHPSMNPSRSDEQQRTDFDANVEAARALTFRTNAPHTWFAAWWMDPVYLGRYPDDGLEFFGAASPVVRAGEMATISQPLDFLGINIYKGVWARSGEHGPEDVDFPLGHPITGHDWPIVPESVYWGPRFLYERYGLPVFITENGLSCRDWIDLAGRIRDTHRIDFMRRYLLEVHRAIRDGVPIEGYFHWSVMDNFEWAEGYKQRFGLIHVDYSTQKRTFKDSARYYQHLIATRGRGLWDDPSTLERE